MPPSAKYSHEVTISKYIYSYCRFNNYAKLFRTPIYAITLILLNF